MEHTKYVIALREVGKVGPKGFQQLILSFGSPQNVFKASLDEIANLPRFSREKAEEIHRSSEKLQEIEEHILYLEEQGIGIVTVLDENFPSLLEKIDDPPPLLYYKGEFPIEEKNFVAVVGTHKATEEGISEGVRWGKKLVENDVVVVSGLALGIDASAHLGAITGGGRTYAVLGSGLNRVYPEDNIPLASQIEKQGALITEYALNVPVKIGQLMARNRIVVGLSMAVIVVEMEKENSGSMDAAEKAFEQGKPVFVIRKKDSQGVESLVVKGAIPIDGVEEIDLVLKYL